MCVPQLTKVPDGEYLLQNAANSVLGKQLIALCKKRGIKTINLVRCGMNRLLTLHHQFQYGLQSFEALRHCCNAAQRSAHRLCWSRLAEAG